MYTVWAKQKAFTIVELLIVIVVIAILAAITIVAYAGIQDKAKDSAAQAAAKQALTKIQAYAIENTESYPPDPATAGLATGTGTTYEYRYSNTTTPKTFCLTATTNNVSYYISNTTSSPVAGACNGHGVNGVAAVTNVLLNPSAETNIFGIDSYGSGNVPYRDTSIAEQPGIASARRDVTGPNQGTIFMGDVGAVPNSAYWCSVAVSGTPGLAVRVTARQLTAGRSYMTEGQGGQNVSLTSAWQRITISFTSTGDPTLGIVALQIVSNSGTSSGTIRADRAICAVESAQASFADGSSPGWIWNGTPNNSTSTGPPL